MLARFFEASTGGFEPSSPIPNNSKYIALSPIGSYWRGKLTHNHDAKKVKHRKDASKDPKDVEIDFLKRELNIVKLHLLEHEDEVKDLKRKNKVLTETVSIFENSKQTKLSL